MKATTSCAASSDQDVVRGQFASGDEFLVAAAEDHSHAVC